MSPAKPRSAGHRRTGRSSPSRNRTGDAPAPRTPRSDISAGRRAYRPATALIGAGMLARALAPMLVEAGYPLVAISSRGGGSARRLCRKLGRGKPVSDAAQAVRAAGLVLLAVPDREVAPLARDLAARLGKTLKGRTMIHHAGSLGLEPLQPLSRAGAAVAVLHPLQCMGSPSLSARILPGSRARIEGDRKGAAAARRLARDLGLVPLRLPPRLSAWDRELYHAAASIASNDLLAMADLAARLLERLGLPRASAVEALLPLMHGTLDQAEAQGLGRALTGPVVRGDAETLAAHLRSLSRASRAGARVHRLLSRQLLELAARTGRLTGDRRAEIRRLLG